MARGRARAGIGINDVLIRVRRTGICGTDVHIYNWDDWAQQTIPVPMVIGHEFVGEIVEVGVERAATSIPATSSAARATSSAGAAATAWPAGGTCARTRKGVGVNRPGAFAEYLALPMTNIWRHRPRRSPRTIAAIFDPFGNAVHTALSFPVLGEDVLITGAGPIGLHGDARSSRHAGARNVVVTDVNPFRLDLARKMGATLAVDVRARRLRRRAEAARHEGGLRRRPGDVRQPRAP